jgi:hypothetical protein
MEIVLPDSFGARWDYRGPIKAKKVAGGRGVDPCEWLAGMPPRSSTN